MKLAIIIILAVCVFFAVSDDKGAMKACEKHHSHAQCFYILNR